MIHTQIISHDALLQHKNIIQEVMVGDPDRGHVLSTLSQETPAKTIIRIIAVEDEQVIGVAVGNVQGAEAYLDVIAVHPSSQGRGAGRAMLLEFEKTASIDGAQIFHAGGSSSRYAWPGVQTRWTPAIAMLLRHGYQRSDTATHMSVDLLGSRLQSSNGRLANRDIDIRVGESIDLATLLPWIRETFHESWAAEMQVAIEEREGISFVAIQDSRFVGFAAASVYMPSIFGPMATDPRLQGLGVGRELLSRTLLAMRDSGMKTAQIGWVAESAVPFYSHSVGAVLSDTFWIMTKPHESI